MRDLQNTVSWHSLSIEEVASTNKTDLKRGLSSVEAKARLEKYGKNAFKGHKKKTYFDLLLSQLKSPLVLILIAAGVATYVLDERIDTIVIGIALLINIIAGVVQEGRAASAFETLMSSQEKTATVIRDGEKKVIPSVNIVPGDLVVVDQGVYVGADIRLVEQHGIATNEAALTGEWISVEKKLDEMPKEARITDRFNMLWMGTLVAKGTGLGVAVATGGETQIGMIAEELTGEEELIPLQKNMQRIARYLSIMVIGIIVLVFVTGILRGHSPIEMALMAIAIAVAVMPEGLPAAVTVVLALGMETILKKGGLVRNLLAAETLGNTTVILTDKTGTLTKAEMRVADVFTEKAIADHGMQAKRTLRDAFVKNDKKDILSMAILAADAFVEGTSDPMSEWVVQGKPVEKAFVLAGLESALSQVELLKEQPRLDYLPFESQRRFLGSLHHIGGPRSKKRRVYISGAPEVLLEQSDYIYNDGKKKKMPKYVKEALADIQEVESAAGMRMIAIGYTDVTWDAFPEEIDEENPFALFGDIVFGGFVSLHDPIRPDVKESIEIAREAGTNVIMVTGDNPVTALKIAQESGIAQEGDIVYTGAQTEKMDDEELLRTIASTHVFARVLPKQKLRIVKLLKGQGEIVAMTGDGINDAPALRSADIGISLGSGTEVAKDASDMVLLNNSFSIIVDAIKEGRRIRDNLKKITTYLIATSFSGLLVVIGSIIVGAALPILPAQILWINILEEGFMNFAFAFEPAEDDVMKRNPRKSSMQQIITKDLFKLIAIIASVTGALLLGIYFYLLSHNMPIEQIRTIIFIALSVDSIFFTFSVKNLHRPIWEIDLLSNKYLILAFMASVGTLILALVLPPLQKLLSLEPLSMAGFAFMLIVGTVNLITIEAAKYIVFKNQNT